MGYQQRKTKDKSLFKRLAGLFTRHPLWLIAVNFLIVTGLFYLKSYHDFDPDFGWHLQTGNYIRAHGVPAHDIYTYTAPHYAWINHEWGNDVIVSYLYQFAGYGFLALVFSVIWSLSLFIVAKRANLAILFLAVTAILPFAGVRPIAWTMLGLALLFYLAHTKTLKPRLLIPLLFLIWANLHGGFIVGIFYLLYRAVKHKSRFWGVMAAVCVLATFVNPYGPRLYVEVYRTLTNGAMHKQIQEWYSFDIRKTAWPYIVVWATGFWMLSKNRLSSWFGFEMLVLLASLSAAKNLPLFVLASLRNTDYYFRYGLKKLPRRLDAPRKAIIAGLAVLVCAAGVYTFYDSLFPLASADSTYPVQAVAYIKQHGCPGNIFNDYNYGGYLIWKLPGKRVYIDGRMSTWRQPDGQEYLTAYINLFKNNRSFQRQLDKYDVGCVLLSKYYTHLKAIKYLKSQGWAEPINNPQYVLMYAPTD